MPLQNFPLLGLAPPQQPPAHRGGEQESPNLEALQRVMAGLESQGAPVGNGLPPALFESLFAQALSQSQLAQQSVHQPAVHEPPQIAGGEAESNASPHNLAEDAAGGISNVGEDEAAKFMAQLLKGVNPGVQAIGNAQSQPTSPNLDASTLLEQLQFMGILNPAAAAPPTSTAAAHEPPTEWRNTPDLNALFTAQGLPPLNNGNATSQTAQSQSRPNDAYCEICDKHLCNRYFLKTHRLKKHGIRETPSATTTPSATSTSGGQSFSSPLKREADWTYEPSTPQRAEGNANMPLANLADPPLKMPRLTAVTDLSEGIKEERSPEKSPDAFTRQAIPRHTCHECDKDFDSLPNLLQHQLLHHSTSQAMAGFPNFLQSAGLQQPPLSGPHTPRTPSAHAPQQTNSPRQPTPASQQHTPVPSSGANVLSQLLPGFQMPGGGFQLPPLFNLANFPSALQFGNELDVARLTQQLGSGPTAPPAATPAAPAVKTPKRQYSSTSKNYCDLCNKEVCNKYFLRTHMLKMHKIVIDENKSVIANIDTLEKEKEGEIWFRCDICRTKLETRQQLREHKRDVHNIAPLAAVTSASAATGGSSSASSECDAGSLRATKTPNSATTDGPTFFGEHPTTADDLRTALEIHENTSPSSSASSTAGTAESALQPLGCQLCAEHFATDSKRQEHLLSAHFHELVAQAAKRSALVPPPGGNVEDDYVTQVALQMARKNQMVKKSRGDGFACTSCGRVYSDSKKYAEHLGLHAAAKKFVGKKNRRKLQAPQKIKKHRMPFSCTKCQRRFS